MLWSLLCYKLGISENVSIGPYLPCGIVVDVCVLEEDPDTSSLLEEYDARPELLNTAFYISNDDEELEEEEERILDEDYDW
jgi:hypothetical protein